VEVEVEVEVEDFLRVETQIFWLNAWEASTLWTKERSRQSHITTKLRRSFMKSCWTSRSRLWHTNYFPRPRKPPVLLQTLTAADTAVPATDMDKDIGNMVLVVFWDAEWHGSPSCERNQVGTSTVHFTVYIGLGTSSCSCGWQCHAPSKVAGYGQVRQGFALCNQYLWRRRIPRQHGQPMGIRRGLRSWHPGRAGGTICRFWSGIVHVCRRRPIQSLRETIGHDAGEIRLRANH